MRCANPPSWSPSATHNSNKKRRKLRGNLRLKDEQLNGFDMDPVIPWPARIIPIEIFNEILKYLPRSTVLNMRLVNKEFERKVMAHLFRVVVVPFKPEIYGIAPDIPLGAVPDQALNDTLKGAIMLQDEGMRVFSGFGKHIQKFALSFEFEEFKLARPPIKSDQEAVTSFWGIYRWPYKQYNRYAALEGLEQAADETKTMATALRHLQRVTELGLSIDGCLGWMAGPDINRRVACRNPKPVVFGQPNFVAESDQYPYDGNGAGDTAEAPNSIYSVLERMLTEAGYQGEHLEQSMRMLLETEEPLNQGPADVRSDEAREFNDFGNSIRGTEPADGTRQWRMVPWSGGPNVTSALQFLETTNYSDMDENSHFFRANRRSQDPGSDLESLKDKVESRPLRPNDLTNAQKEMLLEVEWAQRAFMQSYAIAVIDNPATFYNIETLTIARIPHRQLSILRRSDFFDALPILASFSLAVIPDWREVTKLPTSYVDDTKLQPSRSLPGVYQLLQGQIAHRENIKHVHFEWVCGGEYSPGLFSRNQNILPAPLVPNAMDMINRDEHYPVLKLPHIEHFSLKNCYVSPHVMSEFTMALRDAACKRISFDSVSLTAYLSQNAQPSPLTGAAAAHFAAGWNLHAFQILHPPQQIQQNAPANQIPQPQQIQFQQLILLGQQLPVIHNDQEHWFDTPRLGSWPWIIDNLTPSITLAEIRHMREIGPEPLKRRPTALTQIDFESCGYVRVPLDFDQSYLECRELSTGDGLRSKRYADLESFMLKPTESCLGTIINFMIPVEATTLETAYGLMLGWSRDKVLLFDDCQADNVTKAGTGRFRGVIHKN